MRFLSVLVDEGPRKGRERAVQLVFEQIEQKRAFSCFLSISASSRGRSVDRSSGTHKNAKNCFASLCDQSGETAEVLPAVGQVPFELCTRTADTIMKKMFLVHFSFHKAHNKLY